MIDIWERLEIDEHEENSNLTIINLSLFISMKNEGVPAKLFEDVVIQKLDWNADFIPIMVSIHIQSL